jgi:hypothetical protein
MAFGPTHKNMPTAYEYLRSCEPLCRWKLPEADEVVFRVTRHKDRYGHQWGDQRAPGGEIALSEVNIGSSDKLLEKMAHEMIHHHQHLRGTETAGTQHNAEFKRLARAVCAVHLWDFKDFV